MLTHQNQQEKTEERDWRVKKQLSKLTSFFRNHTQVLDVFFLNSHSNEKESPPLVLPPFSLYSDVKNRGTHVQPPLEKNQPRLTPRETQNTHSPRSLSSTDESNPINTTGSHPNSFKPPKTGVMIAHRSFLIPNIKTSQMNMILNPSSDPHKLYQTHPQRGPHLNHLAPGFGGGKTHGKRDAGGLEKSPNAKY